MRGINPCVSAADSKTGVPPLVYRPKTRGLSDQSPVGANGDHRLTAREGENAKRPARWAGREGEHSRAYRAALPAWAGCTRYPFSVATKSCNAWIPDSSASRHHWARDSSISEELRLVWLQIDCRRSRYS